MMRMMTSWAPVMTSLTVLTSAVVTSLPRTVVDLTHDLGKTSVFWPGQPPFNFTVLRRGLEDFGGWLEVNAFGLGEHGGTHIDAPAHYVQGRWRTHEIPPSRLVGPGVVLDLRDRLRQGNVDYQLSKEDLTHWESEHGPIPTGAVVLLFYGWATRYPDPKQVFNSSNPDEPETFHFPGMSADAARWLAEERDIIAVGTEAPGPDHGGSRTPYAIHQILLQNDILILEYVTNLFLLPPCGATIVIGVVKLRDGSGGPARILALLEPGSQPSNGSGNLFFLKSTDGWKIVLGLWVLLY